ncbi:MAG: hypothetical protein GY863_20015 [bacterium]|nr:hypothetical protein [bacterium]
MKRLLLLISLIFISSNSLAQTKWFAGTFESAKKQAEKEDKVVLLLLTQDSR